MDLVKQPKIIENILTSDSLDIFKGRLDILYTGTQNGIQYLQNNAPQYPFFLSHFLII